MANKLNVILIGIDTLRADRLGLYGYSKNPVSPNIDEFAKDALVFTNCRSQAPHTTPSFMSILTGRYPTNHGVTINMAGVGSKIRRAYGLGDSIPTLAEILQKNGCRTGSFNGGGTLYSKLGFAKGFEYFSDLSKSPKISRHIGIPQEEIFYWLNENKNENFFLFLHTFAVHSPWLTPVKYQKMYDPGYSGPLDNIPKVQTIKRNVYQYFIQLILNEGERHLDHYKAMYDGAIKYVDDFFMNLINYLSELKIMDNTIIIFTSDHGEEFFEHGKLSHEQLYREHLHVPLIIKSPNINPQIVGQLVRSVDIMPTILDFLGIYGELTNGVSLIPALKKDLSLKAIADSEVHGIAIENKNYKYIYARNKMRIKRMDELYDLKNDPGEKHNIAVNNIPIVEDMLDAYYNELTRVPFPPPRRKIIYL